MPVLSSSVGGVPSLITNNENGFLFNPYDVYDLAGQLEFLINNYSIALAVAKKGRETALKTKLLNAGFSTVYSDDVAVCDAAITGCESLIARTGSMVMSSAQQSGRTVSVYAPVHICIAYTKQLVYDISEGLQQLR